MWELVCESQYENKKQRCDGRMKNMKNMKNLRFSYEFGLFNCLVL